MPEIYECPQGHVSSVTRFPNDQGVRKCFFCPSVVHSVGEWGGVVVAVPLNTLETLTKQLENSVELPIITAYIASLNDMYHWNEWIIDRLEDRYGVDTA